MVGPRTLKAPHMPVTIILDIETIPDTAAVERAGVDLDAGFPAWPLHQLACVSLLSVGRDADRYPTFGIKTFSREELDERGIVASVERAIENAFEVVTFNGAGFDFPVLLARAALAGVAVPTIAKLAAQPRYRPGMHVDLLDEVSGFGAAPRVRLGDICAAFGIPVKLEAHGSDVATLIGEGNWGTVTRYCETDVTATWLALQQWRSVQRGDPHLVVEAAAHLAGWVDANQPRLGHLLPYARRREPHGGGAALGDPQIIF